MPKKTNMSGKKAPSVWNLESQIGFYAAYHNNPINQLIHVVFVRDKKRKKKK